MASKPEFFLFTSLRFDPLLHDISSNTEICLQRQSKFYMLPFHRDRLIKAAEHFGWPEIAKQYSRDTGFGFFQENVLRKAKDNFWESESPLKVRVLVDKAGITIVETSPTPAVTESNLFPKRLPPPISSQQNMQVSPLTGGALNLGPSDSLSGDPVHDNPWDVIPDTARTKASSYTSYKTTSRAMYDSARKNVGIKDIKEEKEVLIISESGEIMEGSLTSVYFWRNGKWVTPCLASGGQAGTTRRWALDKGFCVEGVVKVDELINGEECWISNGVRGFQFGKVKLSQP